MKNPLETGIPKLDALQTHFLGTESHYCGKKLDRSHHERMVSFYMTAIVANFPHPAKKADKMKDKTQSISSREVSKITRYSLETT